MSHVCTVCFSLAENHPEEGCDCGVSHFPALCCPGCDCGSYEEAHITTAELIANFRGGIPANCDFCNQPVKPEEAVAEEAGQWACAECWERFEREDAEFGSPTHHRL